MSDIGVLVANLRELQARWPERVRQDAAASASIKARLASSRQLLDGAAPDEPTHLNGNGSSDEFYDSIRENLRQVRQFASDLRNGRY